jgi:hypothetical protein
MKFLTTLLVGVVLLSTTPFAQSETLSFNKLGQDEVLKHFSAVKADLETFSFNTDWKAAKKLRKDIGNLKLLLDVFVYVYPKKGLGEKDSWEFLREELDKGYEVFGNYKDVYDTAQTTGEEIDQEEKERLYKKAQEWNDDFRLMLEEKSVLDYLNESSDKFTKRKNKDLPKYLWRRLDFSPQENFTGVENIRVLLEGLLELGREDLKELNDIKNLTKYENEETFHDWRKGLRNVLKLNDFFPAVRFYFSNFNTDLATLDLAIDKFGDLNDLLVAYHKEDNNKDKKKYKKQINENWDELKEWLKDTDMDYVLSELSYAISL